MRHATLPATVIVPLCLFVTLIASGTPALASPPADGSPESQIAPAPLVAIQPLGTLDATLVRAVASRIRETFLVNVVVLASLPLPESAFYRPRNRYRGERLLGWLDDHGTPQATKIIGLLASDISVTKGQFYDWGVMGVAGLNRRAGVVSEHRLARQSAPSDVVARRMTQVAVHELGHTFGLPHCSEAHCIMNDAEGSMAAVDASSGSFCARCRARLAGLLRD